MPCSMVLIVDGLAPPHTPAMSIRNTSYQEYTFLRDVCPVCEKATLYSSQNEVCQAIVIGSEELTNAGLLRKRCWSCNNTMRHNILTLGKETLNCTTFQEMEQSGVLFITAKTGFSMKYLHLTYLRLMRAKAAPGQEAAVLSIFHKEDDRMFWRQQTTRDHLLHALEAWAIAKAKPSEVLQFNLSYPAKHMNLLRKDIIFEPPKSVTALAFDGHFGIHRALCDGVEAPRTVRKKGHPRKLLQEHQRSCSCKAKDVQRLALPQRTAGWQFVLDPDSRRVLAAGEHLQNETNEDKTRLLEKVLKLPGMKVDLLLHDDACHFEKYVKRNNLEAFSDVKHYVVDAFHAPNHKCSKRYWTGAVKKRCAEVRTNLPEVFNAWIRTLNFFFNGLRPHSHKFWVAEACKFYNDNLQDVPLNIGRRKNVVARKTVRKRPGAKAQKKPAAAAKAQKKPAASRL